MLRDRSTVFLFLFSYTPQNQEGLVTPCGALVTPGGSGTFTLAISALKHPLKLSVSRAAMTGRKLNFHVRSQEWFSSWIIINYTNSFSKSTQGKNSQLLCWFRFGRLSWNTLLSPYIYIQRFYGLFTKRRLYHTEDSMAYMNCALKMHSSLVDFSTVKYQ